MIGLTIALLFAVQAGSPSQGAASDQAVKANLDSCAIEQGRWVCRYTVPDVEIIPFVGDATQAEAASTESDRAAPPAVQLQRNERPPIQAAAVTAAAPMVMEASILTESETRLMNRCADASWVSLCLPDDRRQAREFKTRQTAFEATRRSVTGLIAEDRCDVAVRTALDGGYLTLAGQARAFCAAPGPDTTNVEVSTPEE